MSSWVITSSLPGAKFSKADQAAVRSACRASHLAKDQVLSPAGGKDRSVYFLAGASVALLVGGAGKSRVAVGLVGGEGAVGLQFGLGLGASAFTLHVQNQGAAWVVNGAVLRRLLGQRPALLLAVSRYMWTASQETAVFAAAVQSQSVVQRLAAWVLKSDQGDAGASLSLTHDHLGRMLGVRRASISAAAYELRALGLLGYQRGQIQIRDRSGLELVARATTKA